MLSFDTAFLILVIGALVPLTLFPLVFAVGARKTWWRTPAGFALMVSTSSLGSVLYATLARKMLGDYPHREVIVLILFSGVCVGAWLKFGALVYELTRGRRERSGTPRTHRRQIDPVER